jgi:hypothetical protein
MDREVRLKKLVFYNGGARVLGPGVKGVHVGVTGDKARVSFRDTIQLGDTIYKGTIVVLVDPEDLEYIPTHKPIPADFPVQPLAPGQTASSRLTCGCCGLSWDDAKSTSMTPVPSGRCPFEYFHLDSDETT